MRACPHLMMSRVIQIARSLALAFATLALLPQAAVSEESEPSLVLLIVVDQLRGDTPERYLSRFGPRGFRYFFEKGVVYRNAFYSNGATSTGPGHATLVTGATPTRHGIVGNRWIDPESHREVYCAKDENHQVLGEHGAHLAGTSPAHLMVDSFGDALIKASGGTSHVYSVSVKDRSAIFMAGHLGKAFWYSRQSGRFVTSSYYFDDNPEWLNRWNAARPADRWRDAQWRLMQPREKYRFANRDDQPWERSYRGLGRIFPHDFDSVAEASYYTTLRYTPFADELIVDFVGELLASVPIGQGPDTDVLAVSLSATDRIGHMYGPDSLEAEDNILRVDAQLALLFDMVDRHVGLDNTLVVLSADHGITSAPEFLQLEGSDAERIDTPSVIRDINEKLRHRFKTDDKLVVGFLNSAFYLNIPAITDANLELGEVETFVAESIAAVEGIDFAVTRSELLAGMDPLTKTLKRMTMAFHPTRSGHVFPVQESGWFLQADPWVYAAEHGTPYDDDAHAALMIAAGDIAPAIVDRSVAIEDLAPTIAAYLDVAAPTGAAGRPLAEIKRRRDVAE
jgi:predicted AlkP superfamily pyrophosphatase or phosphodiesterase